MKLVLTRKKEIDVVEDALVHFLGGATNRELSEWLGWKAAEINAANEVVSKINSQRLQETS
jgi:hypothetical protein